MAAVPTLAPEDYRARVRAHRDSKRYAQCDDTCTTDCGACKGAGRPEPVRFPLPGGQGTVTVLEDGSGAVHNELGQAVGVLDPGTVAAITPRPADAPRTPQPSAWRDLVTVVTSWARERGLTVR